MKKIIRLIVIGLILIISLTSCDLIGGLMGGDSDNVHTTSFDKITGKYVLYDNIDKRYV